jgi:hypothetical protein
MPRCLHPVIRSLAKAEPGPERNEAQLPGHCFSHHERCQSSRRGIEHAWASLTVVWYDNIDGAVREKVLSRIWITSPESQIRGQAWARCRPPRSACLHRCVFGLAAETTARDGKLIARANLSFVHRNGVEWRVKHDSNGTGNWALRKPGPFLQSTGRARPSSF